MSQPNPLNLNELPSNSQPNLVQSKSPSRPSYVPNGPSTTTIPEWTTTTTLPPREMDPNRVPPPGSTNGTPPRHPPSLSSHSSRDPSPGSHRHGDDSNLSNSTNSPIRTVNGLLDQRSKLFNTANNGFENISPFSSSHSSTQHSPALPQQLSPANFPKPPTIQQTSPNYPTPVTSHHPTIMPNQNLLIPSQSVITQNPDNINFPTTKNAESSNSSKTANIPPQQLVSYITPIKEPTQTAPFIQSNPTQHFYSNLPPQPQPQPQAGIQTAFKPRPPSISQPMMMHPNSKPIPVSAPQPQPHSGMSAIPGMPMHSFQQNPIPSQGPPLSQHLLQSQIRPNISPGSYPYDPSKTHPSFPPQMTCSPSIARPPMPPHYSPNPPPPVSQSMPHLPQARGPPPASNPPQMNSHLPPQQQQQPMPMPMPQSQYMETSQQPYMHSPAPSSFQNRSYPQQNRPAYPNNMNDQQQQQLAQNMAGLSVTNTGFNKLWGLETVDLLQNRNVLPPERIEPPKIRLHSEQLDEVNCSTEIFRCTLTKIPETNSLLQKSRLPLGVLIHPFKDLNHLPVIQCSTIVRCRACRTYINPFVSFVDQKRWKCNLCFRVNDLPEEFQYDPISKTFGDPSRRPEIRSSTIEFIAPTEYMLRPPQPAVYLFVLDVSHLACESGYLRLVCETLLAELDNLPGDGRTHIGFITYASAVHFYNLAEGLNQPQQLQVLDIQDIFVPCPDNLLVNLKDCLELVRELLRALPKMFEFNSDNQSCLGAALQASYKLMASTGGRVSVFQCCLANNGPGALASREDPSQRAGHDSPHLNPATDFYKRLALECSGQQIAVDLWLLNSQYSDLATLSGISRFSGGCLYHFPLFKSRDLTHQTSFKSAFLRYLNRKIGFEAVMRIRCSRGLSIHTFHGNFFVRSTDLLSLPNVNPDAGFGMQVSVDESLSDLRHVCFQAALLYTSSKGERRIRVHTLCLPVASILSDILLSADQQCIVGLLAEMAVDRSQQSSLTDARDAFINVAVDVLSAFKLLSNQGPAPGLLAPLNLSLLPLYILALLKHPAFRAGTSTRLDDRLFAMCQMKSLPLQTLIQTIYPDLYQVPGLEPLSEGGQQQASPSRIHLSAEKLDSRGAYVMDCGEYLILYICQSVAPQWCQAALGAATPELLPEPMLSVPQLDTPESEMLRDFISNLQKEKPYEVVIEVIRDSSALRRKFIDRLIEDRTESALSYYEFLQHLKSNVK